jgi:uncharacterized repeat protein (TIGR01451 family)
MKFLTPLSLRSMTVAAALSLVSPFVASAKPNTHIPAAVAHAKAIGHMGGNERVHLSIALQAKDRQGIAAFAQSVSDPSSPNFRHYVTPEQFGQMFGASEQDYAALQEWAKSKGFKISHVHKNRLVLSVEADAKDIESAFGVSMNLYNHPKEARTFFSADREPTIDAPVAIASIEGLSSFAKPHAKIKPASNAAPNAGTGPSGSYMGSDFRNAYVPNTTLTGKGETVGLLQFDGFYATDIAKYRSQAGLPNIPLTIVKIDGGVSTPDFGNSEVCLDIEMCMSMAPGLNRIYVYEAPNPSPWMDLIGRMADDNLSRQLSCSWGGGEQDDAIEVVFQQMAAQGQSFFNASGDSDAMIPPIEFPSDSPSITQVGGTTLTAVTGGAWKSEVVWNWGYISSIDEYIGSSGGISDYYDIPTYQQGINMTTNKGSTEFRNIPDVALTADNVYVTYDNGASGAFGGTSCAAPLWAAYMALVNQTNTAASQPAAGFINPFVYALGKARASGAFHDITVGNNTNDFSDGLWPAARGYDLCTGWGTPGTNLLSLFYQANFTKADLQMAVTNGPLPSSINNPITFNYAITNAGPLGVTNAVFTASFSDLVGIGSVSITQGSFTSSPTNVSVNLGALASNGTAHVIFTIAPAAVGFLTVDAAITSEVPDPRPLNNQISTDVAVNPADLGIGKSAQPTVWVGYPFTYTISVTNFGPFPATGVTVDDLLPDGATFISATTSQGDFISDPSEVLFDVGFLDVNYVATMTITALAPATPQFLTNDVIVYANEPDVNSTNDDATAVTQVVPVPPPVYNVNAIGYPTAGIITWNTVSNGTAQVAYGTTPALGSVTTFDGTLRTNHMALLTGLIPDTLYYFQVTSVVSGAVYQATGTFTTTATLILQEPDGAYFGDWTLSSAALDKFGSFYQYAVSSSDPFAPDSTATFNATLPAPGKYDVSIWSPSGNNNSAHVPVVVIGATGSTQTIINEVTGGKWVSLATGFNFPDGGGAVQVMNNTGEQNKAVVANAVKFSYNLGQDKLSNGSIPGWWLQYFFGTNNVAAAADSDGDGYSNYTEYVLGTTPNDPASHLAFSVQNGTNGVTIAFAPYQGGRVYQLQYRADLNSAWVTLAATPSVGANGVGTFTVAPNLTGFFRLQVSVAP